MTSIADSSVTIQTSSQSVPSTPAWFGEVTIVAHYLKRLGVLSTLEERVRFARRRFGHYDLIDFAAVLLGYAISGERTLEAFYARVPPCANVFKALFGRHRLPARSTLSRFLAALDQAPVEALRTVFLEDLLARPLEKEEKPGGLWDRQGTHYLVFDIDGTRQAARQRALPYTPDLPAAQRRLDEVCAPGYRGRKRGEVVRTRTTVLQAHTHQWVGTFAEAGNGDYRGELRRAVKVVSASMQARSLPLSQAVVRLDGQYGNGAIVADLAGLGYVMRGKDYDLLNLPQVQTPLAQPPDQQTTHPATGTCRALFDCPDLLLTPTGPRTRVIVATHSATASEAKIGTTRGEVVYELFYTTALPQGAFTPADVVALYLHRGAFETVRGMTTIASFLGHLHSCYPATHLMLFIELITSLKRRESVLLLSKSSSKTAKKPMHMSANTPKNPCKKWRLRFWRMEILSKRKLLFRREGLLASRTGRSGANGPFSETPPEDA